MNNDATAGGAYNITLHHNLLAHNGDRNPLFDLAGAGQSVNNVTYNAKSRTHSIYNRGEYTRAAYNIIKNYSKAGPHSATKPYTVQVWKYTPNSISFGMYVEGNIDSYRTPIPWRRIYAWSPDREDTWQEADILSLQLRRRRPRRPMRTLLPMAGRETAGCSVQTAPGQTGETPMMSG
jgi:hypothetical protein